MTEVVRVNDVDLGKSFFEELLRSVNDDATIEVVEMSSSMPVAKGSNFLSYIFRVNLTYRSGNARVPTNTAVIVKAVPKQSSTAMTFIGEARIFDRELHVFRNILPTVEKLVGRQVGPKLYYVRDNEEFFVMEDMAVKNFATVHCQKGFSMSQCLLVIEKLAMLHAASVAMFEKEPRCMDRFEQHIFEAESMTSFIDFFAKKGIADVSGEIRKWSGERWNTYADKLDKLTEKMYERVKQVFFYEEGEFCVLTHGDCWPNNILLKEVDGTPVETILIDFQTATYTSPATDLIYFIYMCPEVKLKCLADEQLLSAYLETLTRTMTTIGCKTRPPTIDELKTAMYKRRAYAVMMGIGLYPRTLSNEEDVEDIDEVMTNQSGGSKMDLFKNPGVTESMQRLIPYMDQIGYLD